MGLFSSFGGKVRGLLGGDLFTDRLAQAQAFANGDYDSAARIGSTMRDWRERHAKQGAEGRADGPAERMPLPAGPVHPPLMFDRPGFRSPESWRTGRRRGQFRPSFE